MTLLTCGTVKVSDARKTSPTCYKRNPSNRVFHDLTEHRAYNLLQFLLAVSHSMGAHAEAFLQTDHSSSSNNNGGEDAETEAPTVTV